MIEIDAEKAVELLDEVVEEKGEDFVYQRRLVGASATGGCFYTYNGGPDCLVGHALHKAGATVALLCELDAKGGGIDDEDIQEELRRRGFSIDEAAYAVFSTAQRWQDAGNHWGSALREARDTYEELVS